MSTLWRALAGTFGPAEPRKDGLLITPQALAEIGSSIGSRLPEQGGILGGTGNRITHYYWDRSARCDADTYDPDLDALNREIGRWGRQGISFLGMIHSHPAQQPRLSYADIAYGENILNCNPELACLYSLLYLPGGGEGEDRILAYRLDRRPGPPKKSRIFCR